MYPYTYDGETLDTAVLDAGRDDYYGHSGTWWDVQDSPWLTHLPQFSLAASGAGAREGRRRSGDSRLCAAAARRPSTTVSPCDSWRDRLSARSSCAGEGACTGTGACKIAMNGPRSAVALFGPKPKPKPKPKKR